MTEKTGQTSETRERTYQYTAADMDLDAAMNMTGLEFMKAIAAGDIAHPSMLATFGMSAPFDLEYGKVSIEAKPQDYFLNPLGVVHGGFAATMLDTALGIAVNTVVPKATGLTTAELKINYTRAIKPDTGLLRAEGYTVHVGRQMVTAEGRLSGVEDGKLYAHGSTTCFLFPLKTDDKTA